MTRHGDIIRQHGPMVWRLVYRLVGGPRHEADAADCFQEVFVAALEVEDAETVRNWEALLRRLAAVKGIDLIRRRVRERQRMDATPAWEALAAEQRGVDEPLAQKELVEHLRVHLATLPEPQSTAFTLRHISGLSYSEIAEAMGLTTNAVGVLLTRAKTRLNELMNDNTCERHGEP